MTSEEEWEIREARGRERFARAEFTIKDHYNDPNAPFFVLSYYINAPVTQRIISEQVLGTRK